MHAGDGRPSASHRHRDSTVLILSAMVIECTKGIVRAPVGATRSRYATLGGSGILLLKNLSKRSVACTPTV